MRTICWLGVIMGGLATTGCATQSHAGGTMLGYTDKDHLFAIEHHDPERGGRIVGTVCAVDVQLDARLRPDGVLVTGAASDRHASTEAEHIEHGTPAPSPSSSELPYRVEVRDHPSRNERDLFGMIGDSATLPDPRITSPHTVDLHLTRDALTGQLASRHFDLHARGDDYVGSLTINGISMPYVLRGRSQLWRMPAAAQASILPLLMTCSEYTKLIQMVDLRQTTQPDSEPPSWIELPHAAPRPMRQMVQPMPSTNQPMQAGPSSPPTPQRLGKS